MIEKYKMPALLALAAAAPLVTENAVAQGAKNTRPPAVQHELVTEWQRNPIEYRAMIKQALEGHHGALALILTQRAPDSGLVPFHVEALVALTKLHESLYPEGSATPRTSERIWTDRTEFQKASQRTADLAGELPAVIARGDVTQSVNALIRLGESCQGCHARYRLSTTE